MFLEHLHASVCPALDLLRGEPSEEALDHVEPGARRACEVQGKTGVAHQPVLNLRRVVGGVVVEDEVDGEVGWDLGVDLNQELLPLGCLVVLAKRSPCSLPCSRRRRGWLCRDGRNRCSGARA